MAGGSCQEMEPAAEGDLAGAVRAGSVAADGAQRLGVGLEIELPNTMCDASWPLTSMSARQIA